MTEHCDHECVCKYHYSKSPCMHNKPALMKCNHDTRSRPAPSPQETPLPCIPTPCSYLYIEGMNVHCQDSYSPSRVNCHHCVNWRCWDITNVRENAIRNATLPDDKELRALKSVVCAAIQSRTDGYQIADDYYHRVKSLRTKESAP